MESSVNGTCRFCPGPAPASGRGACHSTRSFRWCLFPAPGPARGLLPKVWCVRLGEPSRGARGATECREGGAEIRTGDKTPATHECVFSGPPGPTRPQTIMSTTLVSLWSHRVPHPRVLNSRPGVPETDRGTRVWSAACQQGLCPPSSPHGQHPALWPRPQRRNSGRICQGTESQFLIISNCFV